MIYCHTGETPNSLLDRLDPTFHKKAHPSNVYLFIAIYLHLLLSSISYFFIFIYMENKGRLNLPLHNKYGLHTRLYINTVIKSIILINYIKKKLHS